MFNKLIDYIFVKFVSCQDLNITFIHWLAASTF